MEIAYKEESYRIMGACFEVKSKYIPDFLLFDKIVLEIKVVKELAAEHRA